MRDSELSIWLPDQKNLPCKLDRSEFDPQNPGKDGRREPLTKSPSDLCIVESAHTHPTQTIHEGTQW